MSRMEEHVRLSFFYIPCTWLSPVTVNNFVSTYLQFSVLLVNMELFLTVFYLSTSSSFFCFLRSVIWTLPIAILNRRLEQKVEDVLGENHYRFINGKGISYTTGFMRVISDRVLNVTEELCSCFINCKQIFAPVNWKFHGNPKR